MYIDFAHTFVESFPLPRTAGITLHDKVNVDSSVPGLRCSSNQHYPSYPFYPSRPSQYFHLSNFAYMSLFSVSV